MEWNAFLEKLKNERRAQEQCEKWLFSHLNPSGLQFDALVQRSDGWLEARKSLLTASRFGTIAELSAFADGYALWELLIHPDAFENNKQTETETDIWRGIHQEPLAIRAYEFATKMKVESTGLFIYREPFIFLGASPDGLISDGLGLVEVKCPRHIPKNVSPEHLAQIQGQLEICNRQYCDLCYWNASEGLQVLRVHRSTDYWQWLLPQLVRFHFYLRTQTPPLRRSQSRKWIAPPIVPIENRGFYPVSLVASETASN